MELNLKCFRIDEDSDSFHVSFRTTENKELFGAEVRVKLIIDKEYVKKFDPKQYKVNEMYKVNIDL